MSSSRTAAEWVVELAARVQRRSRHIYTCPSRSEPDAWHTIFYDGVRGECTCLAGQHGRPCVHLAAVIYRCRPAAPAAAAAPVERPSLAAMLPARPVRKQVALV